jgi:outer membrane immunogenic protein
MIGGYQVIVRLVLVLPVFWAVTPALAADNTPSGTVSIQSTSVAAGVGVQWGDGILTYNGKKYPFSLQGMEVVGVGYAEVKAEGTVYNLTKLSDFEGVYASAEAGAAAGSGPASVTMKNPHGVALSLHALQAGVKLTLAAGGVNIELKH